jgi:hypothetical protein
MKQIMKYFPYIKMTNVLNTFLVTPMTKEAPFNIWS